jgi:hypothetical protein
MDESAADCGQRSILNCIASDSMSSWMCDEEESQERILRSDTGHRQERNGKATHGQVHQILELKLDSKRIPEQPSTTMSRLQLFVRRFTEGNTMPGAVEFSRWEPNPPDDRPNPSNPDPEKRDPVPGHPDPTMLPPEPRQDPPPEPQRGSLNLITDGQSRVE